MQAVNTNKKFSTGTRNQSGYHIMIVDDDMELGGLLALNLEQAGMRVTSVHDGETALQQAQKFDLIVLDITLPRMSGDEVLRLLKKDPLHADTPVAVLTANSEPADVVNALDLGAVKYIVKPFDAQSISVEIKKILSVKH